MYEEGVKIIHTTVFSTVYRRRECVYAGEHASVCTDDPWYPDTQRSPAETCRRPDIPPTYHPPPPVFHRAILNKARRFIIISFLWQLIRKVKKQSLRFIV